MPSLRAFAGTIARIVVRIVLLIGLRSFEAYMKLKYPIFLRSGDYVAAGLWSGCVHTK